MEKAKLEKLLTDVDNHLKASKIRSYLKAFESKIKVNANLNNTKNQNYIEWGYNKADEMDPINNLPEE